MSDLGPVQIPPPLPYVGMIDRTTGTVWYLCFDPSNGNRISLTTAAPAAPLRVFGAWDGPFIGSAGLRMGVDQVNGQTHLVFDQIADAGPCPIGFELNTASDQYAVVYGVAPSRAGVFDHLACEILQRTPPNPTVANQLPGEPIA